MMKIWRNLLAAMKRKREPADEAGQEYIQYCQDLEKTLRELEAFLHTSDDPEEIAMNTLKTACRFYGGDWCGVLEVDLELGIWTPYIWHYAGKQHDRTMELVKEFETADIMPTWIKAMQENYAVIVPDVSVEKENNPESYSVYERLHAKSVIAAPFKPRPVGYLVVRNPTRYLQQTSMLQNLAYVMLNAMNQKKSIDAAKMALSPDAIQSDKDIMVNLFDRLEVYTAKGVLHEDDFKSPKICRLLTYMLLNRRATHPAMDIVEALWPDESADIDAQINSLRGLIYRFRQTFSLVSDYQLIETTPNGYRLNPKLRIMTDLQVFDSCWESLCHTASTVRKVDLLKQMVGLYRGPVFRHACAEHWLVNTVTYYSLRYVAVVNELLSSMAEAGDYSCIQQYATHALDIMPGNLKARYWLIYAMYHMSTIDLAKSEVERARAELTSEEFEELIGQLKKLKGASFI